MVRSDQWLPYSSELAAELKEDKCTNQGGFGEALVELVEVLENLEAATESDQRTPSRSSAPAPRMLGKVSAKKLFEDEMLNEKAFQEKMFKLDGFFRCRQCPSFKDKLRMRAKRHARGCGERPKQAKLKSRVPRHQCSAEGCDKKFPLISELNLHYRVVHAQRRLYRCPPCSKTFVCWRNLVRHREESHRSDAVKLGCGICQYTSPRAGNVKRHQQKKHAENRVGVNDEEPNVDTEEVDDDGDVGEGGASDGENDEAGQDCSDSFEDLPAVRRVQLLINDMWPRREVMGAFELRRLISLVIYVHISITFYSQSYPELHTFTGSALSLTRSLFSSNSPSRKDSLPYRRQHL